MRKTILIVFIVLFGVYSCQIDESYHFTKDFSGTTKLSIDMERYLSIMPDSAGKRRNFIDSLDIKVNEGMDKIQTIEGISNAHSSWNEDSTVFYVAYDFAGVDELNNARKFSKKMSDEGKGEQSDVSKEDDKKDSYGQFLQDGRKKLIYRHFNPKAKEEQNEKMKKGFEDMFKITLTFTFERKIKSVSHPKVQFFMNENKVVIDQTVFTEPQTDIIFELK